MCIRCKATVCLLASMFIVFSLLRQPRNICTKSASPSIFQLSSPESTFIFTYIFFHLKPFQSCANYARTLIVAAFPRANVCPISFTLNYCFSTRSQEPDVLPLCSEAPRHSSLRALAHDDQPTFTSLLVYIAHFRSFHFFMACNCSVHRYIHMA